MNELNTMAKTENLEEVLAFVDKQLEENGCTMEAKAKIDLAVEELFVNIAHYAYQPQTGPAVIRMEVAGEPPVAVITLIDQGIPYNPLAKKDPDVSLSAEDRMIGGLGIYMVKKSMDHVEYEYQAGQNILTIWKTLR